jgi:DMSO/TMAO reductase YedYZ molybdopterin-dependent catalytic subunit
MKITRRSFLNLIPVIIVGVWTWWFFRPPPPSTSGGFSFPVTWNGERTTIVDPNDYRLKIDGDVPNPLSLRLAELYAMPSVQKNLNIKCEEGWSADVPWEGIPISHLLEQAGLSLKNINHVTVKAVTGYSRTLNSDEIANLDYMIALKVDGSPLTADHGYPARLVAPTRSGLDWVKYVDRITATSN